MKKNCFLSIFLILTSGVLLAQNSKPEFTGFWEQTSTWVGGTMPGSIAGSTITVSNKTVVIDGSVKTHSNLTITSLSSLTINAGDTLVIYGNLVVSGVSSLTNNGVLMVTGNVTNSLSSLNNSSTGKMVVMGNYTNSTGVVNAFTGPSYVYGSDNGFLFPPSTSSQSNLASNDPALNTFVNWMYGVLPVQLISFTAEFRNSSVRLSWQTSSESDNDRYLIERSFDERNFEMLVSLPGARTSNQLETYSFTDNEPMNGVSYYRLSQVDVDGTKTYLGIISITNTDPVAIEIYPNPATEYLFVTGAQNEDYVSIKDVTGTHQSVTYKLSEVMPGKTGVKVSDLETGIYTIHITSSLNNASKSLRFVKR